ncbi:MAG: type II toxin-antitoxin system Phd/YefM family antitoxin [Verrucomicrobiota bacterium]
MKLSESVMSISEVKANAAQLIEKMQDTHQPVVITQNGRATAIVQDMQSYEQTQESLALLKILALSQADITHGRVKPVRQAFAEVREQIAARRRA